MRRINRIGESSDHVDNDEPPLVVYFAKDGDTLFIRLGGSSKQRQREAIAAAKARWSDYRRRKRKIAQETSWDSLEISKRQSGRARSRDTRFRQALFTEAINAYLAGDTTTGKAILRDLVNASVGFEAAAVDIPSKSLHRMLALHGNPSTENFFGIIGALQKKTRIKLSFAAKAA